MDKNWLTLGIVGIVCATVFLVSIVAGVTYNTVSNSSAITELVREGYSPLEAKCVVSGGCSYKIRSLDDLKALRVNYEEPTDDDG